jgi:hypothetical protein
MKRGSEHASILVSLRDELGPLRVFGELGEQFTDWHRRLMACLKSISSEVPSCASVCEELRTINYDLPPGIEHGLPGELSVDQIITQASRVYFRNQCDLATELISTLLVSLRAESG